MPKTWFVVQSCDFGTEGPIALGSIIENAAKPWNSLNYHERKPPTTDDGLTKGPTSDLEGYCRKIKEKQGGVWVKFLQLVTFAFGSIDSNTDDLLKYKFDNIQTYRFIPNTQYLKDAVAAAPRVENAIKDSYYKGSMYMITGIKIAENADISYIKSQKQAYASQMNISNDALGLELGPTICIRNAETGTTSVKGRENIVIAFELGEIQYDKYGLSTSTYDKGDLLSDDGERMTSKVRVLGLREWDVTVEDFDDETFTESED